MLVNSGRDKCALQLAGGGQAGFAGTATATTATSLTSSGFTNLAYIGQIVVAAGAYGVITTNSTTVLTVDRWYNPVSPTGAVATTPGATSTFFILPWSSPAWYTALTANTTASALTDTALTGEITTASGGLIRKASTYAHTAAAQTYTLTTTYTANGSDALPVTIGKMGTFDNLSGAAGNLFHETLVSPTATLSASGDQLTLTQTVTMT